MIFALYGYIVLCTCTCVHHTNMEFIFQYIVVVFTTAYIRNLCVVLVTYFEAPIQAVPGEV